MRKWLSVVLAATLLSGGAFVMAEDTELLTLERVFASPSLNGPAPRAVKLSPDGKFVTMLRPRADDRERFDLWVMDTDTRKWRMLVDSLKIGSNAEVSEAEKMQRERARIGGTKGIVAYDWSPDSKSLLVPLDGDIFIADLNGTATRLTKTKAGELDATVSPKGGFVSFVRDQNLYVIDRATQKERALTKEGTGAISWGLAEFVAQEEMDRARGHWWSPDDGALAVARVDESKVEIVSRAAIGAEGTKVFNQHYPRAGSANAEVTLFVLRADGSGQIKVDLGRDTDVYLARVNWAADGRSLYVQRESRDQKRLDMLKVDAQTGASTVLFSEAAKTWINLNDDLRLLKDGSQLWTSERDGFNHIYRFRSGKWSQLTKGQWMVRAITGVDEKEGRIYFTGNEGSSIEQHLFSVGMNGGALRRHSEKGWWHNVSMNSAATRAIVRRSNPNQPEQVYLAHSTGENIAWIEENRLDAAHAYGPFVMRHVSPRFGTIKAADGTILNTKLISPPLQAGKRYPVLVQVYNGPGAGRQVMAQWGGGLHQYLVDQGWIIFSVDGRGSPDRGKVFEDHIYRAMGSVEVEDQLAGVAWLKQQDFVDPARVAVYGWSYGGYMALKLLSAAPGVFAAGVSGAPVTKWSLYDTHYTERYMGNPKIDGAAYAKSDVLPHSDAISDPLLLIHGMADDNVVFEHSTALMSRMQGRAQPFETMVYPGQTHSVGGPKISVHLWRTILDFLDRNVKNRKSN